MTEFQSAELEALLEAVAAQHKFRAIGHTLVIRGTCAACNAARAARPRLVM
jgi:Fur family ferric uptake transcriptional regulator